MRRVRDGTEEYWCGGRVWATTPDDKAVRRYATSAEAVRSYDRHFNAYGYTKPEAVAVDVGVRPGVVCACGKRRYGSLREATDALLAIWRGFDDRRNVRRAEERVYACTVRPGTWHMTTLSREEYEELTGRSSRAET